MLPLEVDLLELLLEGAFETLEPPRDELEARVGELVLGFEAVLLELD